jgi:RNA polymerase sigma factor (sigma-70 family)
MRADRRLGDMPLPDGMLPAAPHLTELYRRFGPTVYRRALALLHNPEEALDVTQDAFVALVERFDRVGSSAEAFALLYQIATYQAIGRVRRSGRWAAHVVHLEAAGADSGQEQTLARFEAAQDLSVLTRGESPRALRAAKLHFAEGHSVTEVGTALALSRKTVSQLLERFVVRARKRNARLDSGAD